MMNILWVLFWYILHRVTSSSLPLVTWHPKDGVREGDTLRLECQVSPQVSGPAIWLKLDPSDPNNHELLSHGQLLIHPDARFSVKVDEGSNTYALMIKEITTSDEGGYQCQVPIEADEEEVQAAPPIIISLSDTDGLQALSNARSCLEVSFLTAAACAFIALSFTKCAR